MFTKLFIRDAIERALKTVAQTAISLLSLNGVNLLSFDYTGFLSALALSGVLSVLTSIVSSNVGDTNSASLVVDSKSVK